MLYSLLVLLATYTVLAAPVEKQVALPSFEIIRKGNFEIDQVGFFVYDLEKKTVIVEHNGNKPFVPASLTKIPSTFMALKELGADYRFSTRLAMNGSIEKGRLKGNLYLIGGGDPFFTSSHLMSMAQRLKMLGINKVEGKFFYNESALPSANAIYDKVPEDETYNPGLSALSVDFNRFEIWQEGRRKNTYRNNFRPSPDSKNLLLVKTNEKFGPVLDHKHSQQNEHEVWSLSLKKRYKKVEVLPIKNPALHTASLLQWFGSRLGIEIPHPEPIQKVPATKTISKIQSRPLINLVESTLEYSNNLLAELIFLQAIKKWKGKKHDYKTSGSELKKWLKELLPKEDLTHLNIYNGSGLHYTAKFSPKLMTKILIKAQNQYFGDRSFWSLLSVSGHKGWLRRRLSHPDYSYRLWAKTGSLDYVSNIAGYFLSKDNKPRAFGLFINDFEKRKKLNETEMNKSHRLRRLAGRWNSRAQRTQDQLLKQWIKNL